MAWAKIYPRLQTPDPDLAVQSEAGPGAGKTISWEVAPPLYTSSSNRPGTLYCRGIVLYFTILYHRGSVLYFTIWYSCDLTGLFCFVW